jgi:hypothetical protein
MEAWLALTESRSSERDAGVSARQAVGRILRHPMIRHFSLRASACSKLVQTLERKLERSRQPDTREKLTGQLASARAEQAKAVLLAEEIGLLSRWMQKDVLAAAGPCLATRQELFDYLVEQLRQRESLCPHRIAPVRSMLANHRDHLLGFVGLLAMHVKKTPFTDVRVRQAFNMAMITRR